MGNDRTKGPVPKRKELQGKKEMGVGGGGEGKRSHRLKDLIL